MVPRGGARMGTRMTQPVPGWDPRGNPLEFWGPTPLQKAGLAALAGREGLMAVAKP
jgi:hypothetical protein